MTAAGEATRGGDSVRKARVAGGGACPIHRQVLHPSSSWRERLRCRVNEGRATIPDVVG
jgi:hypothetical protein